MSIVSRLAPLLLSICVMAGLSEPAAAQICVDTPIGKVCLQLIGSCGNHNPKCDGGQHPPAQPPANNPPPSAEVLAELNLAALLEQVKVETDPAVRRALAAAIDGISQSKRDMPAEGGSGDGTVVGGGSGGAGSGTTGG